MRKLTGHKLNGLNDSLDITVMDKPGPGGVCHKYKITGPIRHYSTFSPGGIDKPTITCKINFQNGPIQEAGVNGVSQESLLAVVIDRLRSFQAGPYACRENENALTNCEQALMWLQKRTRDRLARGVEGTSAK